jgi:hypothetical protein
MHFSDNPNGPNFNQAFDQQNIGQKFLKQPANYYQNENPKILLFSLDDTLGQSVRTALYSMCPDFFDFNQFADGGNLSDEELNQKLLHLFELAVDQDKTIVFIGSNARLIRTLQEIWNTNYHPLRVSYITDCCAPIQNLDFNSIYLKECNAIGFQRHFTQIQNKAINFFRLGEFRTNPSSVEPALRRSEIIYFNLNAVRASDSPGNMKKNPSGFTAEEASAIARSAGSSERLKIFAISAWDPHKDSEQLTSMLVAQMVWYFWEGCNLKKLDENYDRKNLTQYLVEIKNLDYIIRFYKSEKSGKWWFEEPLVDNEFSNQLIPCSYEEYLATVNDQIPERILEMINE